MTINKQAYIELIEQDLAYLNKRCHEGDLELDHIKAILCKSIDLLYPKQEELTVPDDNNLCAKICRGWQYGKCTHRPNDTTTMSNNHYCGECRWMLYEDTDGDGFCGLNSDGMASVPVRCDKGACGGFEPISCIDCALFRDKGSWSGEGHCKPKNRIVRTKFNERACKSFIKKDKNHKN